MYLLKPKNNFKEMGGGTQGLNPDISQISQLANTL
jgi:hypothetical protein